jgi:phthiocerol/phenolphthiocerol synthesis type-I polyketide synthase E
MAEIGERIAGLSPEKRKALEVLLKARQARQPQTTEQPAPTQDSSEDEGEILLTDDFSADPDEVKRNYKRFYDRVTRQLDASEFGAFSYFLNYGYIANGSPEFSRVSLPAQYINRNSVKLVLELIGDCDLSGRTMLDVGCGRGGTIFVAKTFFNPKRLAGIDLSSSAIEFDRRVHHDPRVEFYEGDAEKLAFDNDSFDIVTNVESSHSYPSIQAFYSEVFRVLVPGGYFLYTDLLAVQRAEHCLGLLQHLGFLLERRRDITRNVMLSCDEVAQQRVSAFSAGNDQRLVENFLGAPGSDVYENMQKGLWTYQIYTLRKPTTAADTMSALGKSAKE